jgi:hypothetical protein
MMAVSPTSLSVSVTEGLPSALELTLCRPVASGTLLRLRASGVGMLRGMAVPKVTAFPTSVAPEAGIELPLVHRFSWAEMQRDWMWHIRTLSLAMVAVPEDLPKGTRVVVHCGPTDRRAMVADLTWTLYLGKVASQESAELTQVAPPLELSFAPGPVHYLEAALKPDGRVFVEQFDAFGNPTRPAGGDRLTVTMGERTVRVPTAGRICATIVDGLHDGADREAPSRVALRSRVVDAEGRSATSNAWPLALDGTPIYFGEVHWHTEFSGDGQRTLQAALTSARDELGLDFAGPADHLSPDGTYAHHLPIEQAEISRRFDEPGRFCTLPGAELSARHGHANLYAADFGTFLDIVQRFPYELLPVWRTMGDTFPLEILSALCPEGRAMIVPHHTNMDSSLDAGVVHADGRPVWCALHWPQVTPLLQQGVRLVEIVQGRGAFESEAPDRDWLVRWGGFGGSVRTALLRGHRLGFVGGSDNHTGWPTRSGDGIRTGGLTAIQAPTLGAEALFGGLYHRRCYATSGARIVADATLDGHPMGSELRLAPDAPRHIRIRVYGTAPLEAVQIVSLGTVLADLPLELGALDFDGSWSDDRPGRPLRDVHYYVRVRQSDGHCAWLSPFWVDPPLHPEAL